MSVYPSFSLPGHRQAFARLAVAVGVKLMNIMPDLLPAIVIARLGCGLGTKVAAVVGVVAANGAVAGR